jgi:dolichol-phosphate mannosyltransferase
LLLAAPERLVGPPSAMIPTETGRAPRVLDSGPGSVPQALAHPGIPELRRFGTPAEVPPRLRLAADEVCLVPDFEVLEALVAAGVDSARIAVRPEWSEDEVRWEAGAAVEPRQPFRFGERLLVILPTYNERENLERMVGAILRHLDCEVLVVDDGSPDGTGRIADRLAAARPQVHVLHRSAKQGLGRAYVAGFHWGLERDYRRLFEMDCDFSHPPHDLPRLAHAAGAAGLVIGSRYVPGGNTSGWSRTRRWVSRAGNAYAKLWLGLGIRDATGGFRCYDADLLRALDLDALRSDGYAFQVEMAWRVVQAGGKVRELPIRFADRDAGQSKMSAGIAWEAATRIPLLRLRG